MLGRGAGLSFWVCEGEGRYVWEEKLTGHEELRVGMVVDEQLQFLCRSRQSVYKTGEDDRFWGIGRTEA